MVFISYAQKDRVDATGQILPGNSVDKVLEALSAAGIAYWIDREKLQGGDTYAERIVRNIKACDTFLFLSSEAANASPWTLREISSAVSFGKRILPVRLDRSPYNDAVSLYLASIQYIDWQEADEETTLRRITTRLQHPGTEGTLDLEQGHLPKLTLLTLYAALVVLTGVYALLTYLFLWAKTLQTSEIAGGMIGFVGEFALLMSIYYVIRLLRMRRSRFILPAMIAGIVLCAAFATARIDLFICDLLLILGWLGIWLVSLYHTPTRPSLLRQMSREEVLMKGNDPENLILVYLAIKCMLVVIGRFAGHFLDLGQFFALFRG